MRRSVMSFIALLAVVIGALLMFGGFPPQPARQVSNRDASAIDFVDDKTATFLLAVAIVIIGVVALGGGLATVFWLLTRQVKTAQAMENEPTNPLHYRTYGHSLAIALPVAIASALVVLFMTSDLLPVQAGAEAKVVDGMFQIEFISIAVIFGLVMGVLTHALIYFRAAPDDDSDGKHIHGNIPLELTWTIVPLIFVMGLGVYTLIRHEQITDKEDGEISVKVIGFQWGWQFIYPTDMFFTDEQFNELDERQRADIIRVGGVTSPDLVLLQDQTVHLEMHSIDVIHSFWVPELRVKRDVVPGIETELRYTPTLAGTYRVRCAELCGLNHWQMYADVNVLTAGDYSAWLERTVANFGDPVEAGSAIYVQRCQTCHSTNGDKGTGPTWENLVGSERNFDNDDSAIADLDYIRQSIWNPNGVIVEGYAANLMPQNFQGLVSDLQVEQLFAYMCTLSDKRDEVEDCARVLPADDGSTGDDTTATTAEDGETMTEGETEAETPSDEATTETSSEAETGDETTAPDSATSE